VKYLWHQLFTGMFLEATQRIYSWEDKTYWRDLRWFIFVKSFTPAPTVARNLDWKKKWKSMRGFIRVKNLIHANIVTKSSVWWNLLINMQACQHVHIDGEETLKSYVNQFIKEINFTNVTYVVNNFNSYLLWNNILNQFMKKINPSSVIFVRPPFYRNIPWSNTKNLFVRR
jgi:hypothetical protein